MTDPSPTPFRPGPAKTRSGAHALIYRIYTSGSWPIQGRLETREAAECWRADGRYHAHGESVFDLMPQDPDSADAAPTVPSARSAVQLVADALAEMRHATILLSAAGCLDPRFEAAAEAADRAIEGAEAALHAPQRVAP